jgi:hypothetical protein
MAWSYEQIVAAEAEKWNAEYAAGNAAMEQARLTEDEYALREATERMYRAEQNLMTLNAKVEATRRAQQRPMGDVEFAGLKPHQQQLAAKFGLTGAEMEHALKSTSDPSIDDATRAADYARGKQKRDAWRATGAWDEVDVQKGYRR